MSGDRREQGVNRVHSQVLDAEPDATEDAKWRKASNPGGVPTFSLDGLICTVFNASPDAGTRRE